MADPLIRILIIGGYGGFGARLSRRLAERGHVVLVAGRSLARAEKFCASIPRTVPVVADREKPLAGLLERHRPDLVIDAAGPFQGSDYRVPKACIAHRTAYLDLADARAFVAGIGALDEAAVRTGVPILSGASSVPALSGAASRHLSVGVDSVEDVEIAISASSRGTGGASVIAAILSYVGTPIPIWRAGRWTTARGWQELRRRDFTVKGTAPLRGRWLALADVPDHVLLPGLLPGAPQVAFRAGTDLAHQVIGLWGIGWAVRLRGLKSARGLASLLGRVQRAGRGTGSLRSAMSVRIKGFVRDAPVERSWTLIAERGDGPEIPTLAATILADRIAERSIPPGARSAAEALSMADFDPLFSLLDVAHASSEVSLPPPLYARIMGEAFHRLPPAVRRLHCICAGSGAVGQAEVRRGTNPIARLVGWIMRFPLSGHYPLHVGFEVRNGVETWTRSFGKYQFSSALRQRGSRLVERFGPMCFHFDLPADATGLTMVLRRWTFLGVPLPLSWGPRGEAREWEEDGRFRFDVPIALPIIGPVVHYSGVLQPATPHQPPA